MFAVRFQLKVHVKNSHFDCDWHLDDDGNLLKGVYEYGMGNWDAIKLDSALKLQDKVKFLTFSLCSLC